MLIGYVKRIGSDLQGKVDIEIGDKIATLVSLSLCRRTQQQVLYLVFHLLAVEFQNLLSKHIQ